VDLGRPGWNDIVADGRGNVYVNGAGFNPMAGEAFRPGSVFLVTADSAVRQVAEDVAFPNGMAVTPDNSTLIVADSYRHHLVAFDIGADGGLAERYCRPSIWTAAASPARWAAQTGQRCSSRPPNGAA
jgi:sugar lactone lactonase YvrE